MAHSCSETHAAAPHGEVMRTNLGTNESCRVCVCSWYGGYHHGMGVTIMGYGGYHHGMGVTIMGYG